MQAIDINNLDRSLVTVRPVRDGRTGKTIPGRWQVKYGSRVITALVHQKERPTRDQAIEIIKAKRG